MSASKESVLREAANYFRTSMSSAWGGDRTWFTTGTNVANLVASILDEMADES